MISYDEALTLVLQHTSVGDSFQEIPLEKALGRVLAKPLMAALDSPSFDNSAVDGYGLRVEDATSELRLVARSEAGTPAPHQPLQPGQAARVLTGASIPDGVETVAMQEDTEVKGDLLTLKGKVKPGMNIRRRGEEYLAGTELLPKGTPITPSVLGLAASNGLSHLTVVAQPRVIVIATGTELTAPGNPLSEAAIYDSNGPAVTAAVQALGIPSSHRAIRDDETNLREGFRAALEQNDVVITTGGVSVGDRDLVRATWLELGVEEVFWKANLKPGKPIWFGRKDGTLVFGLPGNPVSALVTFFLFVRPALLKRAGHTHFSAETLPAELSEPIRRKPGREEFVRGRLQVGRKKIRVCPTAHQGSHMTLGAAAADCLIRVPAEASDLKAGDDVEVIVMRWGAF